MARDDLLQQLDRDFDDLVASFEGLSDEAMLRVWFGDWSVRDVLAHVAGWHREMAELFDRMARGERPVPEGVDYNDSGPWNARFAESHRNTQPASMIEEAKASREAFAEAARRLPDERFEEGRAGYRVLLGTGSDHYREHAGAIREWREREAI